MKTKVIERHRITGGYQSYEYADKWGHTIHIKKNGEGFCNFSERNMTEPFNLFLRSTPNQREGLINAFISDLHKNKRV